MMRKTAAAILTLCLAGPAAAQAQSPMTSIGDGVYHYFSDFYGSLVVVGDEGVLVVDPAWRHRAQQIKEAIAQVTDQPVTHVVLSHEHYDHVGGSEVFENAEIVCHVTCEGIFALDVLGSVPKTVTTSFAKELAIDLGGKIVELKHLGVGDGVATTVIYVPDDQVVATADLYGPQSFTDGMWLEDKNYLGTRKILNEISDWPLKHAISGHAESTDPAALRENAAYLNDLYDAVRAELDQAMAAGGPGAAFELLGGPLSTSVKLPQYESWSGYEQHLPKHVWRMGMSIMHGG